MDNGVRTVTPCIKAVPEITLLFRLEHTNLIALEPVTSTTLSVELLVLNLPPNRLRLSEAEADKILTIEHGVEELLTLLSSMLTTAPPMAS